MNIRYVHKMILVFFVILYASLSNTTFAQTPATHNKDYANEQKSYLDRFVDLFRFSRSSKQAADSSESKSAGIKPNSELVLANISKKHDMLWEVADLSYRENRRLLWTLDPDRHIVGKITFDTDLPDVNLAYTSQSFEYSQLPVFNYSTLSNKDDELQLVDVAGDHYFAGGTVSFGATYLNMDTTEQLRTNESLSPISYGAYLSEGDGFYTQTGFTWGKWQPWLGYGQWFGRDEQDKGDYITAQLGLTYLINGDKAKVRIGIESLRSQEPLLLDSKDDSVSGVRGEIYFNF